MATSTENHIKRPSPSDAPLTTVNSYVFLRKKCRTFLQIKQEKQEKCAQSH